MLRTLLFCLTAFLFLVQTATAQCDAEVAVELTPEVPNNVYCAYDTVKLTVAAGFDAYQWYSNFSNSNQGGNPVAGATEQTLELPISEWGFAYFYVEVEYDDTCRTASEPVIIDSYVFGFPAIQHDAETDLCRGDSALIQNAFGVYQAYQWYRDGQPIPGATEPEYWVTQAGTYVLEVNPSECPLITLSTGVGPTFTFNGPAVPLIIEEDGLLSADGGPFFQWAYEGTDIPGATGETYEPAETGNYTVTAIDEDGCTATSEPFFFQTTGTDDRYGPNAFRFFPNPVDGLLYVESPGLSDYRLELLDGGGRLVYTAQGAGGASEVHDLSGLPGGWYVARVYSEGETAEWKLLVR